MGLVNFLLDEMKTCGRTLGMRVSFNELIQVPKRMHPTGPGVWGGRGWGRGRGCLPNQLLTSNETVKFIEEVVERIEKKEKVKNEKKISFVNRH